jgi:hypothetical protein
MSDAHPTLPGFRFVDETEFVLAYEHPDLRVLLVERKQGAPMPAEDVEPAHREFTSLGSNTKGWGLIIDTRPVTGNNDSRFEAAISRVDTILLDHFGRVVVLVRSEIGKLHATRLSTPGESLMVSTDLEAALEFLAH